MGGAGCTYVLKAASVWQASCTAVVADTVIVPDNGIVKLSLRRRGQLCSAVVHRGLQTRRKIPFCMAAQQPAEVNVAAGAALVTDCQPNFPPSTAFEFASSVVSAVESEKAAAEERRFERQSKRQSERFTYLLAAIASSVGITTLAAGAVYYRFAWQVEGNGDVPVAEMLGTFALAIGASIGMEYWARWAHRALWHASLWNMHESHHQPREGAFELNDIFAIINAVPAILLITYGFFNKGFVPGLCFGAGIGITMFGMAYMFVHDGLVHRRFSVGPIADVPYLQKVAAAHQLHHADLFGGVPYGLFLGPKELEDVGGAVELQTF